MRIVVGLGNPGEEYAASRHNIGFMILEHLAERWGVALQAQPGLRVGRGVRCGSPVLLVEPWLYMNRSGEALAELAVPYVGEDLVVMHDDIDLPFGQLRLRSGGGTGGHRGVESVVSRCGPDFDRLRVGVGRPPEGMTPSGYVLMWMTETERREMKQVVELGADAIECLLAEGMDKAMNRFNSRPSSN